VWGVCVIRYFSWVIKNRCWKIGVIKCGINNTFIIINRQRNHLQTTILIVKVTFGQLEKGCNVRHIHWHVYKILPLYTVLRQIIYYEYYKTVQERKPVFVPTAKWTSISAKGDPLPDYQWLTACRICIVQNMVSGQCSWRTDVLGVVKLRGIGVYLLGSSL